MDGFKLIKTTFAGKKEIVGVHFNGEESYNSFLREVRKEYNIPKGSEVLVYSTEFIVKPKIFVNFVAQYINNLDFVLDIKVTHAGAEQEEGIAFAVAGAKQEEGTETVLSIPDKIPSTKVNIMSTVGDRSLHIPTPISSFLGNLEKLKIGGFKPTEIESITEIRELLGIKNFENKHRTKIAKAIISSILNANPDKRLLREEFLQLAQSIIEVFPTEVRETYYVPFTKGHLAKGKLYDAYNNKRARLSSTGLIRRRVMLKPQPTVVADDSHILSDSDVDENQLEILKTGCADWNLVLEIWRKSYSFRKNEFKYENFEIADYMEKYKVLQHEKNYELFEIDFKILYPLAKSIYEWKLYHHKIIDKAEKLRDSSVRDILTAIENTWEEDSKLALSLLLVPYLLPKTRKKSKSEVQESFITYYKKVLKEEDGDDSDHSAAKRLKFDTHPKIYFVGNSCKAISFAYLDFLGRRHVFEDPLKAVEISFHCFMGSHSKYPKSCEHVWLFLQKLIFQINTPEDAIIPSTNTLVNDIGNNFPKENTTGFAFDAKLLPTPEHPNNFSCFF